MLDNSLQTSVHMTSMEKRRKTFEVLQVAVVMQMGRIFKRKHLTKEVLNNN